MSARVGRWLALPLLLCGVVAWAYLLPPSSVIRHMVENRDELQVSALKVDGSVTWFGGAAQDASGALGLPSGRPEVEADATFYLKMPGRCRFEAQSAAGGRGAALNVNGRRKVEGAEVPGLAVVADQICAVLADKFGAEGEARGQLYSYLRTLRIDAKSISLGRFGGQVAYVIGDPAEGKPQLWVYKESFFPARIRFVDVQGAVWDVRLLDYNSPSTGQLFPRMIEVYRGNEQVLRFSGLRVDTRGVPDRLFDSATRG